MSQDQQEQIIQVKKIKCSCPTCGNKEKWTTGKPRGHRTVEVPLDFKDGDRMYCSIECRVYHEATLNIPEEDKFKIKNKENKHVGRN